MPRKRTFVLLFEPKPKNRGIALPQVRANRCVSIVRKGCREAELLGGCSMLAVEAMEAALLLLSLAVRCSACSAHAACQPRRSALSTLLPRANRPVKERPLHHTLAVRLSYSHACSTHR